MAEMRDAFEDEPCPDVGAIVREIRYIDGRSLDEIGGLIGKSRSWLSRVESGQWPPEKIEEEIIDLIIEICRYRDKTLEDRLDALRALLINAHNCHRINYLRKEIKRADQQIERLKLRRKRRNSL